MTLSHRHQRLLKQIAKTEKPWFQARFIRLLYLLPLSFVAVNIWHWDRITRMAQFCIAMEVDGDVVPLDMDFRYIVFGTILLIGFTLCLATWFAVSLMNSRRRFREILESKGIEGA